MKKVLTYFLSVFVVVVYVLSTMGYGIHECKADGTKSLILLFGESPCEYVHSHLRADGTSFTHSHSPCACCDDNCLDELSAHSDMSGNETTDQNCSEYNSGKCSHLYDHNSRCCNTTIYILSSDQQSSSSQHISYGSLPFLLFPYFNEDTSYLTQSKISSNQSFNPCISQNTAYTMERLSLFSQFRI